MTDPTQPGSTSLVEILDLFSSCVSARDAGHVAEVCVRAMAEHGQLNLSAPAALHRDALHHIHDGEDAEHDISAPLPVFEKVVAFDGERSGEEYLTHCAIRYAAATEPLHPIWSAFARASAPEESSCVVFLRDGLQFLPTLLADGKPSSCLLYTRDHARAGIPPRAAVQIDDGHWVERSAEPPRTKTAFIDTGLYGTLVSQLVRTQLIPLEHGSVFFLTSRNPYILGVGNTILGALDLTGEPAMFEDIVALVDTAESLLKPCQICPGVIDGENSRVIFADPVRLVCSMEFFRASFRYAERQRQPLSVADWLQSLQALHRSTDAWYIRNTLEKWPGGDDFVAKWPHGPLPPMLRYCGIGLK